MTGFKVTQDTTGLPEGSCSDTQTEELDVTVTPKPILTVTKKSSTDLCESATGLQQVARFEVAGQRLHAL